MVGRKVGILVGLKVGCALDGRRVEGLRVLGDTVGDLSDFSSGGVKSPGGKFFTGNPGVELVLKVLLGTVPSSVLYTLTDVIDDSAFNAVATSLDEAVYEIAEVVCCRNVKVKVPVVAVVVHLISCTSTCWLYVPGSSPRGHVRSLQSYPSQPSSHKQPWIRCASHVGTLFGSVP